MTRNAGTRWVVNLSAVLLGLALVLSGCAAAPDDTVTRTGSRKLGENDPGFVGGKSLTQIEPAKRQPAPVAEGAALSGRGSVSTGDYPGKVVVINVWGSWCGPCRLEAKDLAEASKETAGMAAFVGINVRDSFPAPARAFVRAFEVPYPHIYDPTGAQLLKFAGTLPPNGIPTTLIIDKQGRIAARIVGIVSKTTLVTLIRDTDQGR